MLGFRPLSSAPLSASPSVAAPGAALSTSPNDPQNLILQSEIFNSVLWTKEVGLTVTANAGLAPDGTSGTADELVFPAATLPRIYQTVTTTPGHLYTFSVWLRSLTGSTIPSVTLMLRQPGFGTTYAQTSVSVTTSWAQFSVTGVVPASSTMAMIYHANGADPAWDMLAWGAQFERASAPGTYVATTATAFNPVLPTAYAVSTAALTAQIRLAGAPAALATLTAALFGPAAALQAAGAAVAASTAALTAQVRLASAQAAQATSTAALTAQVRLASTQAAQATSTAALTTTPAGLSAAPVALATSTAALTTAIRLAAAPAGLATVTAALTAPAAGLSAAPASAASATAALTTSIRLAAAPAALATFTSSLAGSAAALAAGAIAQAQASAALTTKVTLQVQAVTSAAITAALLTKIRLAAAAQAAASGLGDMQLGSPPPPKAGVVARTTPLAVYARVGADPPSVVPAPPAPRSIARTIF